jgi:hypothetical protein
VADNFPKGHSWNATVDYEQDEGKEREIINTSRTFEITPRTPSETLAALSSVLLLSSRLRTLA